ncbi:hypothetical protein PILCRDRAFT_16629 [Piloderma croceum F 1598]|uniref:Uncharacterized protein n=1 Tax=Piloderma croceum (strain F 1598) TaxID=765440 RepID=A0A0C3EGS8_PILCF|nr:hypothetical protein PILCRDRAFT_16629 [Piloderma croceum F 1598]
MSDENSPNHMNGRKRPGALQLGPRKKPCGTDPLIHHGRHFGRTLHAFCSVSTLLNNGIERIGTGELDGELEETLTPEERREHRVFKDLLLMVPGLEERLTKGSNEDIVHIADLIQKGSSSARSDDTKSLKGAILDWITPRGQPLRPQLARNVKTDRGFHHERTGALLCPAGLDWSNTETKERLRSGEMAVPGDLWPIFLYHGYNFDPEDPWNGLFRSSLLISGYKYIFTSPSSIEKEAKATRSGNARIHGMTQVTSASIAYIRFALSSSPIFSRTDTVTDSERFYGSIRDLFDDADEQEEVNDLLMWWNRQIFPDYLSTRRPICKNSALTRIKEKRAELKAMALNGTS